MEERRDYEALQKIENQQRNEAEQKREEQRKADEIKRVAEHRDDILRMEKLEKRKDTQRVLDQRAHEQLMITMMQNMFQESNIQPQRPKPRFCRIHQQRQHRARPKLQLVRPKLQMN